MKNLMLLLLLYVGLLTLQDQYYTQSLAHGRNKRIALEQQQGMTICTTLSVKAVKMDGLSSALVQPSHALYNRKMIEKVSG